MKIAPVFFVSNPHRWRILGGGSCCSVAPFRLHQFRRRRSDAGDGIFKPLSVTFFSILTRAKSAQRTLPEPPASAHVCTSTSIFLHLHRIEVYRNHFLAAEPSCLHVFIDTNAISPSADPLRLFFQNICLSRFIRLVAPPKRPVRSAIPTRSHFSRSFLCVPPVTLYIALHHTHPQYFRPFHRLVDVPPSPATNATTSPLSPLSPHPHLHADSSTKLMQPPAPIWWDWSEERDAWSGCRMETGKCGAIRCRSPDFSAWWDRWAQPLIRARKASDHSEVYGGVKQVVDHSTEYERIRNWKERTLNMNREYWPWFG